MQSENSPTAYLELPNYPHKIAQGCVSRTIDLDDLLEYDGPRVFLDLDEKNRLIGIEILASNPED
jgi:hypothetical protein